MKTNNHYALIYFLIKKDLLERYGSSMKGFLWILVKPTFMLLIFTFVFSTILKIKWGGDNHNSFQYAINIYSGLFIINYFNEALIRSCDIIRSNKNTLTKINAPIYSFVLALTLGLAFELLINALIVFTIIFFSSTIKTNFNPIYLLLNLTLCIFFTSVISLIVSYVSVFFKGLKQIITFIASSLIFITPVFYSLNVVPLGLIKFYTLNPITHFIDLFRLIYMDSFFDPIKSLIFLFFINFVTFLFFKYFVLKIEPFIRDEI